MTKNILLILASYFFIIEFNGQFAAILFSYTVFIYFLANQADRLLSKRVIYWLLIIGIVTVFFIFKYYSFFQEPVQATLYRFGINLDLPTLNVLLPMGLSYYTFHSVSYVVSTQEKEIPKTNFFNLSLYLSFFPSLVAGPINRAVDFLPQIQSKRRQLLEPQRALFLITLSLIKLFLLSAYLSEHLVDPVFRDPNNYSASQNLVAVYAYAWNIYFNFSGYTDLVTGLALLLGFKVPVNFNAPYLAANLKDFWGRWHISLSTFIRDYIYIPLGGSKKGFTRTNINVLFAFVLSGLWHGAAMTFVVWGAIHGVGLVLLNIKQRLIPSLELQSAAAQKTTQWIARFICFHFVCFAWIFFRSNSIEDALSITKNIASFELITTLSQQSNWLLAAALLFFTYPLLVKVKNHFEQSSKNIHWSYYPVLLATALTLAFALAPTGIPNFIYASF